MSQDSKTKTQVEDGFLVTYEWIDFVDRMPDPWTPEAARAHEDAYWDWRADPWRVVSREPVIEEDES